MFVKLLKQSLSPEIPLQKDSQFFISVIYRIPP